MSNFSMEAVIYRGTDQGQPVHVQSVGTISVAADGQHLVVTIKVTGDDDLDLMAVLSADQAIELTEAVANCACETTAARYPALAEQCAAIRGEAMDKKAALQ